MQHPALTIVESVCKEHDGVGISGVGAIAALRAMGNHWKDHLAEGHSIQIVANDIKELRNVLDDMRDAIMSRGAHLLAPTFVIYSRAEAMANDGAGFWNNETGWGPLEGATQFQQHERLRLSIPMRVADLPVWLSLDEAKLALEELKEASKPDWTSVMRYYGLDESFLWSEEQVQYYTGLYLAENEAEGQVETAAQGEPA